MRKPSSKRSGNACVALLLSATVLLTSACDRVAAPREVAFGNDSTSAGIPLRFVGMGGAAISVPVYINGEGPIDLILDTGATYTCIDEELANELQLREKRGMIGSGVGIGGAGRVRLLQADSLQLGDVVARDIMVCALDLSAIRTVSAGARGLLGLNFLKEFRVELDFAGGEIRLHQ